MISDETIEYVGILAKLELSKEEQKAGQERYGNVCWIILIS